MKLVTPDLYLLHHLYQHHGYDTTYLDELADELEGKITRIEIFVALGTIGQWGFLEWEYGETKLGRAGKLYRLDPKYATEYLFKSSPLVLEECEIQSSASSPSFKDTLQKEEEQ